MITVEVKFFSESDEDEAKKFIKDVKEMPFGQLFNRDSCSEIYRVQIASSDRS